MDEIIVTLAGALGIGREAHELGPGQMTLRAAAVFVYALVLLRVARTRFRGGRAGFDFLLAFMLGSVLSRAITGQSPFFPTLAAGGAMVFLHSVLSWLARRSRRVSRLVKEPADVLIRDGEVDERGMRRARFDRRDLRAALLRHGVDDVAEVKLARLERNGRVSVLKADRPPRVVSVRVEDGVQTVRVELG